MNRGEARAAFDEYVRTYDPTNPRIALKIDHTLRVADLCERLARGLKLGSEDVDLAWLAGLLHDIGRFEQVRRYDSFNDAATVSHAQLGAELLFAEPAGEGEPLIRRFIASDAFDELLHTAVATHSNYVLPEGLDPRCLRICQILRDADKIDIIKVNALCPIEDIYRVSEREMRESKLSPACVQTFYEHRCLPRGIRAYPADILLGHICFAWELVYPQSLAILLEQGHLEHMLSRTWSRPETQEAFDQMAAHLRAALAGAAAGK